MYENEPNYRIKRQIDVTFETGSGLPEGIYLKYQGFRINFKYDF